MTPDTSGAIKTTVRKPFSKETFYLIILGAIHFLQILDFLLMMPMGARLADALHVNAREFTFLITAYTFSAGLSGFFCASFIDRYDRKMSLLICFAGFTLGTFCCASSATYYQFLLARIFTGVFGGNLSSLIYSTVADIFPPAKTGSATGFIMSAFPLASIVGVPIALFFSNFLVWTIPFNFISGIGCIVLCIAYLFFPSSSIHIRENGNSEGVQTALSYRNDRRTFVRSLLFMALLVLSGYLVLIFFSRYLVKNVDIGEDELSLIYFVSGLVTFVSNYLVGFMIDKFGAAKIFVYSAAACILPIVLVTHLPPLPLYTVLIVSSAFFILQNSRFVSATAFMMSVADSPRRGRFLVISSSVQQFAGGVAGLLSGYIVNENETGLLLNYDKAGIFSVVCIILSIVISFFINKK